MRTCKFNWRLVCGLFGLWLTASGNLLIAQEPARIAPDNWRARRAELEQDFEADLNAIVGWCGERGLEDSIEPTLGLLQRRDLGRQYIFPPSDQAMPTPGEGVQGEWLARVNAAKVRQAERVLELATEASDQEAGAVAFQLLHEVIFYDRDHAGVRKMLGHKKTPDGWKIASEKFRIRPTKTPHDIVNWPARQFIRMQTSHFTIESSASEERTRFLAEKLERWYWVWRQVFFEYWSSPANVKRWIQGKSSVPDSRKRYRVVFFKDKNEYVGLLGNLVPGIKDSSGYYVSSERISFFYDGNEQDQSTWRHELTHQLFRESGRSKKDAFETQFTWLDEGIATYFETLADFGDYVTLGGWESHRLQYARIRRLLEGYYVPMKQLSAMGRTDLQRRADIAKLYTEAAGLTDMLMNDRGGANEQRLTDFLRLIYKGRVKSGSFEKIIGTSFKELDVAYLKYLDVDAELVGKHLSQPETRTVLSFSGTVLEPASYRAIGRCVNLTMLDLSNNSVLESDFQELAACQRISQLILTRCRFEAGSLRGLELFPVLDDVDLSGSSIQDSQLASFKNLGRLRTLKLASTAISDNGLMLLATVPGLVELDVSGTKVTAQGILNLKRRLPNLRVNR